MLAVITHRGPDDQGTYRDSSVALGVRRLSIIDVAGGHQPMFNEDESLVVVFNGEIYNYRTLRGDLLARGHVLKTNSDTEILVHLYEEYRTDCVSHLRGIFAFAIWDKTARRLFLARDHLGVKPLYYTRRAGGLFFGSEIKSIVQHPAVDVQMKIEALSDFLSLRYIPAPHTLFSDIFALAPGHWLQADENGVKMERYWDVSFSHAKNHVFNEAESAEQLEYLLRESVQMELMSDVPFGAFLSGGLDSSMVVALMSEFHNGPIKTFCVGFEGVDDEFSEVAYARIVAEKFGTEHHEVNLKAQDFIDLLETVVWHTDQPIADYANAAYYMVSKLASKHVKMVLTGEGGDELFAGYARYAAERFAPLFGRIPASAKAAFLNLGSSVSGFRRSKSALYALFRPDEVSRFTNWFPLFNMDQKRALLNSSLQTQLNGYSTETVFAEHLKRTDASESLNRLLYVDTKLWLPGDLLERGDKLSMAVSLEARVPLLDYKVVEFAASLPPHFKVNSMTRKYLLRKVARKWLPEEIIKRKKRGFPVPVPTWLRGEARPMLRDLLSASVIRKRGLFDPVYVERLLREHETQTQDHTTLLYGLMILELWQQIFVDKQATPARGKSYSFDR